MKDNYLKELKMWLNSLSDDEDKEENNYNYELINKIDELIDKIDELINKIK